MEWNEQAEVIALGRRIRDLRSRQEWDQEELAERSQVSSAYISRLEAGKVDDPKAFRLRRIARALGLTLDGLMGEPAGSVSQARSILRDCDLLMRFTSLDAGLRLGRLRLEDQRMMAQVLAALDEHYGNREEAERLLAAEGIHTNTTA